MTPLTALGVPEFIAQEMARAGRSVRLRSGQFFLRPGAEVDAFAIVQRGGLRVFTAGAGGREITLYGVERGQCCMINVLCLISGMKSPAYAVAEEDVEAAAFPRSLFLHWLDTRADVREFVFGIMAGRVASMMALVEEVAFQRLDCRLASYLLQKGESDPQINLTHEVIASDLGTAREVVSRLLKSFERQGLVELARGRISLTDPGNLRDLCR